MAALTPTIVTDFFMVLSLSSEKADHWPRRRRTRGATRRFVCSIENVKIVAVSADRSQHDCVTFVPNLRNYLHTNYWSVSQTPRVAAFVPDGLPSLEQAASSKN